MKFMGIKVELTKEEENLIDFKKDLKLINRLRRQLHQFFNSDSEESNRDYRDATELLNDFELFIWGVIEGKASFIDINEKEE